jgi:hypothetical protein
VTEDARYESGHGGYSGTIAEKSEYVMITVPGVKGLPTSAQAAEHVNKLFDDSDPRIDDKWGPAGCIEFQPEDKGKERAFVFFGYASS